SHWSRRGACRQTRSRSTGTGRGTRGRTSSRRPATACRTGTREWIRRGGAGARPEPRSARRRRPARSPGPVPRRHGAESPSSGKTRLPRSLRLRLPERESGNGVAPLVDDEERVVLRVQGDAGGGGESPPGVIGFPLAQDVAGAVQRENGAAGRVADVEG